MPLISIFHDVPLLECEGVRRDNPVPVSNTGGRVETLDYGTESTPVPRTSFDLAHRRFAAKNGFPVTVGFSILIFHSRARRLGSAQGDPGA